MTLPLNYIWLKLEGCDTAGKGLNTYPAFLTFQIRTLSLLKRAFPGLFLDEYFPWLFFRLQLIIFAMMKVYFLVFCVIKKYSMPIRIDWKHIWSEKRKAKSVQGFKPDPFGQNAIALPLAPPPWTLKLEHFAAMFELSKLDQQPWRTTLGLLWDCSLVFFDQELSQLKWSVKQWKV